MGRALALLLSFLAGCASSPPWPALDDAPLELAGPCIVELEPDARPIARVDLGVGEPRRFLLDSGSTISLIAGSCADELGLERNRYASPFDLTGSGGRSVRLDEYVVLARLEIGALAARAPRITLLDDPVLAQAGIDGILGQDLLARLVLVVDMQSDVAHVLPSWGTDAIRTHLARAGFGRSDWAVTPLELRPCPFGVLDAAGAGRPFELEVDTGAGDTSLPADVVAALGLESIGLRMSGAVGGNFTAKLYRLEDFELFGTRVSLDVSAAATEYGLLGMDVLGEMVFVLDGPGRALWLQRRG